MTFEDFTLWLFRCVDSDSIPRSISSRSTSTQNLSFPNFRALKICSRSQQRASWSTGVTLPKWTVSPLLRVESGWHQVCTGYVSQSVMSICLAQKDKTEVALQIQMFSRASLCSRNVCLVSTGAYVFILNSNFKIKMTFEILKFIRSDIFFVNYGFSRGSIWFL